MSKGGHVYIMANRYRGTVYIGVTSHLATRIFQHRTGDGSDFCKRYGLDRLVYAEPHNDIGDAIAREKALKKWNRDWKFRLIEEQNPDWLDLFDTLNA
ncbi:excinuclease ABC subunit C [Sphingopyxis sp. H038]|uniref:GIY-YIG nuclease family protein n=1 Tax=unclassified Sphingopyxis TaxID=2614943 RepID=UPI000730F561|nr:MULTISPECIES: GIY-YIG nuclease family protein [unclassified Sphingopyxis]KTD99537.1 excinuclease ABC subunit C [Sphingopyxis sp. H012]KTE04827.1 excinuclease ABC subunit C [Sphingopyxis sp. H093]KTE05703.1 excinuclease ABC subunit C [Sphingopyxis sp. H053]KTE19932.1 excinuclease ABC subunit C [Sphingopyxis sp. H080]KTE32640.1 excinuclease ABC subunit C [Sphingopyxis sp. H038]